MVLQSSGAILHSHQKRESSSYFASLPTLNSVISFYFSLPKRYLVLAHFRFKFHLSDQKGCYPPFHLFICHLYIIFGEISVSIFCPFKKLDCLVAYCWVLRVPPIFWIQVFYHISNFQMFSPTLWLVFSSSDVFYRAKVFILMTSSFSNFFLPWWVLLSSRSYTFSLVLKFYGFTFKCVIYFELFLCKIWNLGWGFILYMAM